MWISKPDFLACSLIPLTLMGLYLLLKAESWHIEWRVKLAFFLVIVLALAILAMH